MSCEPWQCAEVSATKKAMAINKPEIAVSLIKRANRPLLVVGSNAIYRELDGKLLIEYLIDFARAAKVPIVATAHIVGEFLKRDYKPAGFMSAMDIGNRLVDPEWQGIDGKGPHDLVMFIALPYYMQGLILSGLMHFAPKLRTVTLDNMYHPHASWSFPNAGVKIFAENLKVMTSKFEGGQ
ncbi:MAG: CO dehydrogenase/acetyl-CoA synthase complex subunit epsilon, partial [Flavobacteriaceae bacterium]